MGAKARVLVADSHLIFRAGVRSTLEEFDFVVVAETVDCAGTVAGAMRWEPDICLVDTALPGGFDVAVRALTRRAPSMAVVVLTETQDVTLLIRALRVGARGFLVKDLDLEQLPRAMSAVVAGEAVIPRRLVAPLLDEFKIGPKVSVARSPHGLTNREQEVLDMLRAGWSTSRIAGHLVVSPGTVRTHVAAVLAKLHAADRKALLDATSPSVRTPV